jgi:hypothetical protein
MSCAKRTVAFRANPTGRRRKLQITLLASEVCDEFGNYSGVSAAEFGPAVGFWIRGYRSRRLLDWRWHFGWGRGHFSRCGSFSRLNLGLGLVFLLLHDSSHPSALCAWNRPIPNPMHEVRYTGSGGPNCYSTTTLRMIVTISRPGLRCPRMMTCAIPGRSKRRLAAWLYIDR